MSEVPMGPGRFYEFDYTFKLIDPFQTGSGLNYAQVTPSAPAHQITETPAEKRARLAEEKKAELTAARHMKEMERARAQAERKRQAALQEQQREWARQEKARLAEAARIQREGDGSPDDLACKSYGFKPNSLPYAECRQRIATQRQAAIQQQQFEMQRQRLAEQELIERQRQARAREEDAADRRRQAALDSLLNHVNRQLDRPYEALRNQPTIIYEGYEKQDLWKR